LSRSSAAATEGLEEVASGQTADVARRGIGPLPRVLPHPDSGKLLLLTGPPPDGGDLLAFRRQHAASPLDGERLTD
jgi:hypothetical protein